MQCAGNSSQQRFQQAEAVATHLFRQLLRSVLAATCCRPGAHMCDGASPLALPPIFHRRKRVPVQVTPVLQTFNLLSKGGNKVFVMLRCQPCGGSATAAAEATDAPTPDGFRHRRQGLRLAPRCATVVSVRLGSSQTAGVEGAVLELPGADGWMQCKVVPKGVCPRWASPGERTCTCQGVGDGVVVLDATERGLMMSVHYLCARMELHGKLISLL